MMKDDMGDKLKIQLLQNGILDLEKLVLQMRECLTGIKDPDLHSYEHAAIDCRLALYIDR